jgi:hypothetical protein
MPTLATVTALISGSSWASASRIVPLNLYNKTFDVSLYVQQSTAVAGGALTTASSMTWTVQHTFDNIPGTPPVLDGSYTEPVFAVRLLMNGSASDQYVSAMGVHDTAASIPANSVRGVQMTVRQGGY